MRLLDFNDHPSNPIHCRWPINEPPKGGEYLFCGEKTESGCPYCAYHDARAYGSGTVSERSFDKRSGPGEMGGWQSAFDRSMAGYAAIRGGSIPMPRGQSPCENR